MSTFKFIVTPFHGDPEVLDFFIEQVKAKTQGDQWSESEKLNFIKSKLADKALKFYASSAACKKAESAEALFALLKKSFRCDSNHIIASQYNNIKFNGVEDIRVFANNVQNLVYKRFPSMQNCL